MRSMELALAIARAGGVKALADKLGISSGAVAQWQSIPPRRLAEVARATGLSIAELHPEFGAARPGLAEAQASYVLEAGALGLDAAAIAAKAVREAIGAEKARRWTEENREAIAAWNKYFEDNDTPLAQFRQF